MRLKYLSIFDKRGEKMARKEFETLTPQMFYILLSLYEPLCGLEIMEKVNEMTEGDVSVGAGTLYALLPRFENIGYIQLLKEENKRKISGLCTDAVCRRKVRENLQCVQRSRSRPLFTAARNSRSSALWKTPSGFHVM